jgi:hypothetical protein
VGGGGFSPTPHPPFSCTLSSYQFFLYFIHPGLPTHLTHTQFLSQHAAYEWAYLE